MTCSGESIVKSLLSAIERFEQGEMGVEEAQSRIGSASTLLESTHRHLRRPLEVAEGDLEVIRFTRPERQQVPEALAVVDGLRRALAEAPPEPQADPQMHCHGDGRIA